MRITNITIKNFRSIKNADIVFPQNDLLILVGANNAGKSNVIRAVNNLLGPDWWSDDRLQTNDFYGRDRDSRISIRLTFDNGESASFKWDDRTEEYKAFWGTRYLSNDYKERCPCTYLGADRTFDRHMSFADWTLLGKIRKTFNQRCAPLAEQLSAKFEDVVSLFDQVEGFTKFKQDFAEFFQEMQAETPIKMSVDFKPFSPNNYFKTMQVLASDPSQGGSSLDLEELGEGSRNLALLALLRSYAVNMRSAGASPSGILALEEPEIYLHPQAQRNLFRVLKEIASSGIQVIISTHSDCFLDTEFFESIGVVRKNADEDGSGKQHSLVRQVTKIQLVEHCRSTGVPPAKTDASNITEYYKTTSNARLNEAFFARFVILAEGETEELVLPEYLKACGLDCDMRGVSVIAVEGKNQIPKYWRLFSAFQIPLLVIFDNDDDGSGEKRKSNTNLVSCFDVSLEQILAVTSWAQIESARSPRTQLIILKNNFETAMRNDFSAQYAGYDDFVAAATALIRPVHPGQGKGLIARYVARQLLAAHLDYKPAFVSAIASHVNDRLGFRGATQGGSGTAASASQSPCTDPV
jgi:putative ATP-dependent endonuclease of the OLD family